MGILFGEVGETVGNVRLIFGENDTVSAGGSAELAAILAKGLPPPSLLISL